MIYKLATKTVNLPRGSLEDREKGMGRLRTVFTMKMETLLKDMKRDNSE